MVLQHQSPPTHHPCKPVALFLLAVHLRDLPVRFKQFKQFLVLHATWQITNKNTSTISKLLLSTPVNVKRQSPIGNGAVTITRQGFWWWPVNVVGPFVDWWGLGGRGRHEGLFSFLPLVGGVWGAPLLPFGTVLVRHLERNREKRKEKLKRTARGF